MSVQRERIQAYKQYYFARRAVGEETEYSETAHETPWTKSEELFPSRDLQAYVGATSVADDVEIIELGIGGSCAHTIFVGDLEIHVPAVSVSPFEQLDRLREDEVVDLIASSSNLDLPFSQEITSRLDFLNQVTKEEEGSGIAPESIRGFLLFLRSVSNLKSPEIVLSASGNVCAQWQSASDKLFVAEFLSARDVRFVVFAPGSRRTLRLSGLSSVEELWKAVLPHGVGDWSTQ